MHKHAVSHASHGRSIQLEHRDSSPSIHESKITPSLDPDILTETQHMVVQHSARKATIPPNSSEYTGPRGFDHSRP